MLALLIQLSVQIMVIFAVAVKLLSCRLLSVSILTLDEVKFLFFLSGSADKLGVQGTSVTAVGMILVLPLVS